jgi:plasmid stabilization system protein ParE
MDTGKLAVVVSEKYSDDLKNIFQYGIETFGHAGALLFYDNMERLVNNLGIEYYMYPECRRV